MKYRKKTLIVPGQVTEPAILTEYILEPVSIAKDKKRPLVIIVPGGGYWNRSDREKEPIAMQFLSMGYHACVIDYSVAPNVFPVALMELALAVAEIRSHASEWNVDEKGILICGFSAGGHLACSLGTFWNLPAISEGIGKRPYQIRPDGLILCYPVITSGQYSHSVSIEKLLGENPSEDMKRMVSLELQVTEDMPPVFLWHTVEDHTVPVENSMLLAAALQKKHISFELHLYPTGRHGLSLACEETAGTQQDYIEPCCQNWIMLVHTWIKNRFEI